MVGVMFSSAHLISQSVCLRCKGLNRPPISVRGFDWIALADRGRRTRVSRQLALPIKVSYGTHSPLLQGDKDFQSHPGVPLFCMVYFQVKQTISTGQKVGIMCCCSLEDMIRWCQMCVSL